MKALITHFTVYFLLITSCISQAQVVTKHVSSRMSAMVGAHTLTVDDIITLSKAGISDDVIIRELKKEHKPFDLTADQIIRLKTASVSERVMKIMIDPSAPDAPIPAPPVASARTVPQGASAGEATPKPSVRSRAS